jgi:hypothetical protein
MTGIDAEAGMPELALPASHSCARPPSVCALPPAWQSMDDPHHNGAHHEGFTTAGEAEEGTSAQLERSELLGALP